MIKQSELVKNQYNISEVAKMLNVHVKTIQRWDREGILEFTRSQTNRRILSREKVIEILDGRGLILLDGDKVYQEEIKTLDDLYRTLGKPLVKKLFLEYCIQEFNR